MNSHPKAIITGASRGIGLAVARSLADSHHLLLGGRDYEALSTLAAEFPSAVPWACDLGDSTKVQELASGIDSVDVLVHCAGMYTRGLVADRDREDWRREFELNLFAPAELTRFLLPALRKSRGIVVFLNSGAGQFSYSKGAVYSGTKFALKTLADTLRLEERESGLRVTSIHPGRVDTDLVRTVVEAEGGTYDPTGYLRAETVAEAVRLAVTAPADASFDSITVRPAFQSGL
ncbi:SDR family oxidoreductase [Crystallibacter degradans]|uniref:SDR family oxidoreductase n=1 Tax=Crystallibacter degradans TaxID=2726743 RepID=UPI0014730002|nr:SDR family oxidoreductase [Arthrobacter sp. SF27]NMR32250.1 SDR family oxidoreductase [Arthrobacter sp. SF27]